MSNGQTRYVIGAVSASIFGAAYAQLHAFNYPDPSATAVPLAVLVVAVLLALPVQGFGIPSKKRWFIATGIVILPVGAAFYAIAARIVG